MRNARVQLSGAKKMLQGVHSKITFHIKKLNLTKASRHPQTTEASSSSFTFRAMTGSKALANSSNLARSPHLKKQTAN